MVLGGVSEGGGAAAVGGVGRISGLLGLGDHFRSKLVRLLGLGYALRVKLPLFIFAGFAFSHLVINYIPRIVLELDFEEEEVDETDDSDSDSESDSEEEPSRRAIGREASSQT